jgi:hypothetical protein
LTPTRTWIAVGVLLPLGALILGGVGAALTGEVPLLVSVGLGGPALIFGILALVVLVRDAFQNPRLTPTQRLVWVGAMITFTWFALPFYWWIHFRSRARDGSGNDALDA